MRCENIIQFSVFPSGEKRSYCLHCQLELGHEGRHKWEDRSDTYIEEWDGTIPYIDNRNPWKFDGSRKYTLEWDNYPQPEGVIESEIQYWCTIGGNNE